MHVLSCFLKICVIGLLHFLTSYTAFASVIQYSACNPDCNYTISLESNSWTNDSSLFLFTLTPLEHDLKSVFIVDASSSGVTVPLSTRYGMYSVSLAGYTAPLSLRFTASTAGNSSVGVVCREDLISSETTCEYLPTTYVAPISYQASVFHSDSVSALRFALPYPALNYKAIIRKNGIFSVNETVSSCKLDSATSSTDLECLLNVSISTTGMSDPLLPYEAQIPLQTYSYSRASLAPTLPLLHLSYLVQDSVSPQTLLTHISQFASITLDPLDSSRFSITGPSSDPSTTPAPVTTAIVTNTVVLTPVVVDWRAVSPPLASACLGIVLCTKARQNFLFSTSAAETVSVRDTLIPESMSLSMAMNRLPTSHDYSAGVQDANTAVLVVAFEQGYRVRDTLIFAFDLDLISADVFLSDTADCVLRLPHNITCTLKTDIPRNADGLSIFSVHSEAFARAEDLNITVTHLVPTMASMGQSGDPTIEPVLAPLATKAARLLTHLSTFNNVDLTSVPWPESYDPVSDQLVSFPFSDSFVSLAPSDPAFVLTNQLIHVEVGCLLEKSHISINNSPCTRVSDRSFSCALVHDVLDALSGQVPSVTLDKFVWHHDMAYRSSPIVLKRILTTSSGAKMTLESSKFNVHAPENFFFEFNNLSLTIMLENTTLTADLHGNQAPRLFYPSVDRLVLNVTEPLFKNAAGETLNIIGSFTPLIPVASDPSAIVDAGMVSWQLDPAAAVPLECYPVSTFAVACLLTAETASKRGRVSVSVTHDQPLVTPKKISVSASIYTGTDISACGGYNPVEVTAAALSNVESIDASPRVDAMSTSAAFVAPQDDILAARSEMRRLAMKWRTGNERSSRHLHNALQTPDAHMLASHSMMPTSIVDGLLPADWSLAFMATTADVHVVDLWSTPATASRTTSWALSPGLIWLWPTLGAILLLIVVYRVHKWRTRKGVSIHPHYVASATNMNAMENTLDMQANPCAPVHGLPALPMQPWDSRATGVKDQRSSPHSLTADDLPAPATTCVELVEPTANRLAVAELVEQSALQQSALHPPECRHIMWYPDPDAHSSASYAHSSESCVASAAPSEPDRAAPPPATSVSVVLPTRVDPVHAFPVHAMPSHHVSHAVREYRFPGLTPPKLASVLSPYAPIYNASASSSDLAKSSQFLTVPARAMSPPVNVPNDVLDKWSVFFRGSPSPTVESMSPLPPSTRSHHTMCTFTPFRVAREDTPVSTDTYAEDNEQGLIAFTYPQMSRTWSADSLRLAREVSNHYQHAHSMAQTASAAMLLPVWNAPGDDSAARGDHSRSLGYYHSAYATDSTAAQETVGDGMHTTSPLDAEVMMDPRAPSAPCDVAAIAEGKNVITSDILPAVAWVGHSDDLDDPLPPQS